MIGEVASNGFKCFRQRISLGRILHCKFLSECRINFASIEKCVIVLTQIIRVEFVEFDGIDALAVLIDQLDHIFEKGM